MAKEGDSEFVHITRLGVLHHLYYRMELRKYGVYWLKVPGSDRVCDCPDREGDRRALLGIGGA